MAALQNAKRKIVSVSDFRFTGRVLGKGNFARVEEATHSVLNVKVAIKIINIKEIKEKYVHKHLHREARIMSCLNHPCIAALFQTMQLTDTTYFLVTELIQGGDLCSFIIGQRYGKLEERPTKIFARQFASALAHMHSFGIIHRDLKMENVILNTTQTQIKIVDFGLSNIWSNEHPLKTHCGSPEYAAPELFIAGREYGPEVDLWSLGIILYGMVVGQLPFVGGKKNQISSQERRKRLVAQINKGLSTTQRQAIAPLSSDFRMMLHKLLAADPSKRITIKELIVHPWLTERGRKQILKHPYKELDNVTQTKIKRQISNLFKANEDTINTEINKNRFGRVGGMYNILCYKYRNEHFKPENIVVSSQQESASKPRSAPPTQQTRKNSLLTKNPTLPSPQTLNPVLVQRKVQQERPHTSEVAQIVTRLQKRACASAGTKDVPRQMLLSSAKGMGDGAFARNESSVVFRNICTKNALANEPIARSIAGYLVKNVPERMLPIKKSRQ